ncbi:MAG: alpha/beta hydrolase [Spirochaetaceae bacterium]|nr:alpha/beta hydrolase [Spirochaetaceae bacterium]
MVAANGARFHVAVAGDGPLVLFLHGFPQFWWAWRHQLPALAAAGYRAAAMDLRGFGASDKPPRGYDPRTLAEDAAGVIRSLGERDAVVVGQGLGGQVAWTLSVVHPRQVRRLVAVSMPHPRRLRRAHLTDARQVRASRHVLGYQRPVVPERHLVAEDGQEVGDLIRAWAGPGFPDADTEVRYRQAVQIPGVAHSALESYRWAVRSIPRSDGLRYARRMSAPVTVATLQVHGAIDRCVLASSALGSGRYVEASYRFHLMQGVGHFPPEEAPAAFNTLLLDWLADPEPEDR